MIRFARRTLSIMTSPSWTALQKYSACDIADALLRLNVPGAGFLPDILPISHLTSPHSPSPPRHKLVAPAMTILMAPKASPSFPNPSPPATDLPESNTAGAGPYADHAERNSIVVISQPAGQSCAVVGGIMAQRMAQLGARGVVVDGRVRDLGSMVQLAHGGLAVWAKGTSVVGAGAEAKFHAKNVPVRVGETMVKPGDIVVIDPEENGVVTIPKERLEEVLVLLPQLVGADEKVMQDVESGVSVKEAFRRHRNT